MRVGAVNELSVFLKVKPGHEKQIREVYVAQRANYANLLKILQDVGAFHEGRNVLFDNDTRLFIGTSFDAPFDTYIDDFAPAVLPGWDKFLVHCEGYPDADSGSYPRLTVDEVKEYLIAHQETAASFIGLYMDLTAEEILRGDRVNKAFQQVLDHPDARRALEHPALKPLLELAAE